MPPPLWASLPPASPPPSSWRTRVPRDFKGRDWGVAWREAKAEAREDASLYRRVAKWVAVLRGESGTHVYWVNGSLPRAHKVSGSHPLELLACPSRPGMKTRGPEAQPHCEAWWATSRKKCVVYVVGVGEIRAGGWEFAHRAARHRCVVHGYDPAPPLRAQHERYAAQHNFSFHFTGLRGAATTAAASTKLTSYGVARGDVLYTLDELAAANPPGERQPTIMSIDVEGYEWGAIEEMSRNPKAMWLLAGLDVLHLDMHFHLRNPPSVRQFVHACEFLFETMRFRLSWMRNGDGYPADQKVVDFLGTAGLPAGLCCYETTLVREGGWEGPRRKGGGWRALS